MLSASCKDFYQPRISPDALHYRSIQTGKFPKSLNPIIVEIPLKYLSICQLNSSSSFLCISDQHPLIILPIIV